MKRKLAFVIPSLDAGGGEKSLVNLLNTIDAERYEIDLVLFHKRGIFLPSVPAHVRILEPNGKYDVFKRGLISSVLGSIARFDFALAVNRVAFAVKNKMIANVSRAEQSSWPNVAATLQTIEGEYDAAIGFLEKSSIYFAVDKITAKKKIGFIHTNYRQMGIDAGIDRPYFKKLDAIVTVSDECHNVLCEVFPEFAHKTSVMHNIVSPQFIHKLAIGNAPEIRGENLVVSVGRLHRLKGFDMAVEACANLVRRGIEIQWFVIGDGEEREKLQKMIADHKLETHFHLLGLRENPYPYVSRATVYVQPSRLEGKSIAIDEAKILSRPIVVTNYTTVADQITEGVNGIVCPINADGIADAVAKLLGDRPLRERLSANLASENLGTANEITKLYDLIDR